MHDERALAHMNAAILQDRVVLIQDPLRKECMDGWEFYGAEHIGAPMYIQHMLRQYEALTYRSPGMLGYESGAMRNELLKRVTVMFADNTDKTMHAKKTKAQILHATKQKDKEAKSVAGQDGQHDRYVNASHRHDHSQHHTLSVALQHLATSMIACR